MTGVTRGGFCKIRPLREGVLLCNWRRAGIIEESYYRMLQLYRLWEMIDLAPVGKEAESEPETRVELIGLVLAIDGTPSSTRTPCDRIRTRRRGGKSNRR